MGVCLGATVGNPEGASWALLSHAALIDTEKVCYFRSRLAVLPAALCDIEVGPAIIDTARRNVALTLGSINVTIRFFLSCLVHSCLAESGPRAVGFPAGFPPDRCRPFAGFFFFFSESAAAVAQV